MFTEAKDDGSGAENWSYKTCKAPVKLSPSTTNTQLFMDSMPFLSPNQQCQSTEGKKYHISWTCLPQVQLGVFQLRLWPLIAHGYLWLPCLSSALWCQYHMVSETIKYLNALCQHHPFPRHARYKKWSDTLTTLSLPSSPTTLISFSTSVNQSIFLFRPILQYKSQLPPFEFFRSNYKINTHLNLIIHASSYYPFCQFRTVHALIIPIPETVYDASVVLYVTQKWDVVIEKSIWTGIAQFCTGYKWEWLGGSVVWNYGINYLLLD